MFLHTKRIYSHVLFTCLIAAFVWIGSAAPAHASGNLVPAFGCQAVNGKGSEHIRHMAWGITNASSDPVNVVCPVSRPAGAGASIYVNGTVEANMAMGCVLLSITYNGAIIVTKSFVVTGASSVSETKFDKHISLSSDEAPVYSYQTLYCDLPPNRKGALRGYMAFNN